MHDGAFSYCFFRAGELQYNKLGKGGAQMSLIEIDALERHINFNMSVLQSHHFYEIYFLLRGRRNLIAGNRIFDLSENSVCIIPPFCTHKTEGGPYLRFNINVSPELLMPWERTFLEKCAHDIAFRFPPESVELLTRLLWNAVDESILKSAARREMLLAHMHVILQVLRMGNIQPLAAGAAVMGKKTDTVVLEIVSYLNAHCDEELTLDGIAALFYLSKNALCRRFRAVMDCSVMQYLTFVRISLAKRLLVDGKASIEEISRLCGFSSANYFGLVFKKEVGMSPYHYRINK